MKKRIPAGVAMQDGPDPKEIFGTWIAGYESGDVDQVMSVFDAALRYIAPCQPVQDFDALASWFKYDFKRTGPRPNWSFETVSVDVGGDLAVIVSRWTATSSYPGFSADVQRLRSIDFLRLGAERSKIFRTINDPEPCETAPTPVRLSKKKKK
jgi:ketosteroid isomerase-like protein